MYIVLHVNNPYSCQILMKLESSQQLLEKYTYIKFRDNLSSGSRVVSCGRTDRHDEANRRSSQFCERALKKRNTKYPTFPTCSQDTKEMLVKPKGSSEQACLFCV
jgi:hypothetical protein